MSLTTLLIIFLALDLITGGVLTASLLGVAAGATVGGAKSAAAAAAPPVRGGIAAIKKNWWGAALLALAGAVTAAGRGAAVGAWHGAGPGFRRGHQVRRRGLEWLQLKAEEHRDRRTLTPPAADDGLTPTGDGLTPTGGTSRPFPGATPISDPAPAGSAAPTTPTGAGEETRMTGEDRGARPYVDLWATKVGSTERIHAALAELRDELSSAAEANGKHEVGGAQDVIDKLASAVEAVGDAGEAIDAHGTALSDRWSGVLEQLDKVGAESASELVGQT